ncbi:MAG: hypothetical protein Q4C30_04325 [Bacteroidia bacterium]|nr:hypothetical protein [Bacteroidia bacterium]
MGKIVIHIAKEDNKRIYGLEQILVSILGLELEYIFSGNNTSEYTLEYNGECVTFPIYNNFSPQWVNHEWAPEQNIVSIYGNNNSIDIAMSAFYLLSRVEEVDANADCFDKHGRFMASSSLACQMGFIDRPMVNEYAELIVNIFTSKGVNLPVKRQGAKFLYTHDVDILTYEPIIKGMLGDILKRHDIISAIKRIQNLWHDEHDTFESLMNMSESRNQKGMFNIMATHYDPNKPISKNYLKKSAFSRMLNKITSRGHLLGYHPGYHTSDDEAEWKREREKVEHRVKRQLTVGRQHYLRVFVPRTLEIWEDNNMNTDSSLGFADRTGFRCGTGCLYHPYDFRTGRAMSLLEQPLIVMDTTMEQYEGLTPEQKKERITLYDSLSKKYDMPITLLYHN